MGNLILLFLFVLKILQIGFSFDKITNLKIYLWGALSSLKYCCVFLVIMHGWIFNWQISFLYFNFIGLMQCSKTLSIISSTDWERTIWAMKLHQYFEFGPASQDPFSFCQIQLTLDTVQWSFIALDYRPTPCLNTTVWRPGSRRRKTSIHSG